MTLSLLDKNLLSASTSRVVKRADFEHLVAAHDVLAVACESTADQQAQLETLRQEATRSGHAVGVEQGKEAWAQELIQKHRSKQTQLSELHPTLVEVVMSTLHHLLAELPSEAKFELLAQQVLRSAVRARHLRLVVAQVDAAVARSVLERWQHEHPDVLAIDVVVDDALTAGDCVLETDDGAVDGRLSQRLASIESCWQAICLP
jgi:flagellar biosynthesis/type III secretory pathway protein FliH